MSETKFTPGNWSIEDRMSCGEGWAVASDHEFPGAPGTTHRRYVAQIIGTPIDARLIAAAPELYEALNALVQADGSRETFALFGLADSVDNDGDTYQSEGLATVLRRARSALSKARGETE